MAIILSVIMVLFVVYSNAKNAGYHPSVGLLSTETRSQSYGDASSAESQEYSKVITETIEGKLNRGAFEEVIGELETLTEMMEGYAKSLRMTYRDRFWSGTMICKVPPKNVTSFTFNARAIIEENGTVTYINISIEKINASGQNPEGEYSTINFYLQEVKPESGENQIITSIASALPILTTSLVWIANGLVVGVPLCFTFLGIVILVNRGIIPLWKNTIKKTKSSR